MSEFAAGFKVFEADRFALKEMAETATDWGLVHGARVDGARAVWCSGESRVFR